MKLIFQNTKYDAVFLLRRAGYGYERKHSETNEVSFGRRLGVHQYPKFHVYARKEGGNLIVNLHLDQKRPSYESSHAHSGEYEGEVLEQEAERIKLLIDKAINETEENETFKLEAKKSFLKRIFRELFGKKQ